jgi:hypothetical protein
MVTRFYAGHTGANFLHHAAAFMAKNGRKYALGVFTGQCECVGVTHAGRYHAYQDFTRFGALYIYLSNLEWLAGFDRNSST